jgi:hypothetical protein
VFVNTSRIAAISCGLALAVGTPAAAIASSTNHGHGHGGPAAGHGKGHGQGKGHHKPDFTAVGKVASVDAGTITITDKGGSKALHGTTVTVSVPDTARVIVDDADGSLDDVVAGDHVVVKGSEDADTYTAKKVVASSSDAEDSSSDDPSSDDTE